LTSFEAAIVFIKDLIPKIPAIDHFFQNEKMAYQNGMVLCGRDL